MHCRSTFKPSSYPGSFLLGRKDPGRRWSRDLLKQLGTSSANTTCCRQLVNRFVTTCLQTCNNLCVFTCVRGCVEASFPDRLFNRNMEISFHNLVCRVQDRCEKYTRIIPPVANYRHIFLFDFWYSSSIFNRLSFLMVYIYIYI